jgi:hypothetical protein
MEFGLLRLMIVDGLWAAACLSCVLSAVQSYVAELLPTNSTDPSALTMAALQGATVVQINSSVSVLALARSAGFDSIGALMPGLQMFWDDVSNCYP